MSDSTHPTGGVFLSYAREDAAAARRIAEALRAFGVETWFDEQELRGGDAWDAQIRKQIRECRLFVPIISATTQARGEGYFRREWRLAVERQQDMAAGMPFVVPVVIDDTPEKGALVPDEFMRVQWTRLPKGIPSPQFVDQVKKLLVNRSWQASPPSAATAAAPAPAPATRRSLGGPLAVGGLVVAAALAWFFARREPTVTPPPVAEAKPAAPAPAAPAPKPRLADKSIAVLPFTNMSEDKDNAFFADGVHEDVLTNLALIRELRVVSRTSVQTYRGTTKSMKQIAEELGVTYILEGSVRRVGNKVRVTGQLIHAATDEHVWAQTYDRDLTDIFAIQSELSREIAGAMKAALSPEEKVFIARTPTTNPAAYDEFLKGRSTRNRSPTGSRSALVSAEQSFQRAVELDPNFATAWAELSVVHALKIFWGIDASAARRAKGDAAIARAQLLAPEAPEVIRLVGTYAYYANRDYAKATECYEKLLRLQPNDPTGYESLGLILRRQGRWAESLANLRKAVELEPGNVTYVRNLLSAARYCRRWDEARAMQQRLIALLPDQPREQWFAALLEWESTGNRVPMDRFLAGMSPAVRDSELGRFLVYNWAIARDDFEAFKVLDAAKPVYPEEVTPSLTTITAAAVYYGHGDKAAARARIEPLAESARAQYRSEPDNFRAVLTLGCVEFFLGNSAEALRLIRQAADLVPETRDALDAPAWRYYLAMVYANSGQSDQAIAELRRLLSAPGATFGGSLRTDQAFMALRGDARFEALLNDPKNQAPLF
jgi:TolB-like protein/Flp pilus assembly protein TadD